MNGNFYMIYSTIIYNFLCWYLNVYSCRIINLSINKSPNFICVVNLRMAYRQKSICVFSLYNRRNFSLNQHIILYSERWVLYRCIVLKAFNMKIFLWNIYLSCISIPSLVLNIKRLLLSTFFPFTTRVPCL